jgi:hypothetical protein
VAHRSAPKERLTTVADPSGTAVVHIGPVGDRSIVNRFYERCGLEHVGPARISVADRLPYDTLEQLIDNIQIRPEMTHVVVNHGSDSQGLIVKYVTHALHNATGEAIGRLADAASATGSLDASSSKTKDLASRLGASSQDTLRLIAKLANLRKTARVIAIRGCNIGQNPVMLREYKRAFGAAMVTAPKGRMFYQPVHPNKTSQQHSLASLRTGKPHTGKTRRRVFESTTDSALRNAPIVIDVQDVDGHAKTKSFSFMDDPDNAVKWAVAINGAWRQVHSGPGSDDFIMQVMWNNQETSYHTCYDASYVSKLVFV